ncbi:MAG TPA: hypothetical protein VMW46_11645 [Candidatus Desulfaltia sp.]|nr:hypothetical protein [Candidatus Desulfaltia sp.]
MNNHIGHPQRTFAARHGSTALRIFGLTIAGVGFAVLFAFVFGLVVKVLWNWLMPAIFGLGEITFWQAFGIVLLAKLLFGAGHGHSHKDHHERFESHFQDRFKRFVRSEEAHEEGAPVPGNGRKWRHFRQYWQDEGRAAFESYVQRMGEKEEKKSQPDEKG